MLGIIFKNHEKGTLISAMIYEPYSRCPSFNDCLISEEVITGRTRKGLSCWE